MTKERIQAQHEETGRMWEGPRDQLPKGYSELPPSKELDVQPVMWLVFEYARIMDGADALVGEQRAERVRQAHLKDAEIRQAIGTLVASSHEPPAAPVTESGLMRYDIRPGFPDEIEFNFAPKGEWVRFDDVWPELQQLRARASQPPGDAERKDWRFVAQTLQECQNRLQAKDGGARHSWMDPALDIARGRAGSVPTKGEG